MAKQEKNLTAQERTSLKKTLSRKEVWAFAFGSVVGWGWIMLAGGWVETAGVGGAIVAFIIGAVLAGLIGLAYAELTPMLPLAGGEMVWAYRSGGYKFGWFAGWAICFAYVAVAAWEGPAFATAVSYLLPIPDSVHLWTIAGFDVNLSFVLISLIGSVAIMYSHWKGIRTMAIFNTIAAIALVVGGVVFFGGSVTLGSLANIGPMFKNGFGGISVVMMAAPAMFIGFDVIPQAAEEMDIPKKQLGYMVLLAVGLGAIWYIAMVLAVGMAVPDGALANANIPLADAASMLFGSKIAGYLLIVAGIGGIITSWNAMFIGATRIIFGMARANMLPPVFAKTSKKYGTPVAAILLVGILGMLAPLLGKNALGWFVDASSLGTVVAYLCVAISYVILRRKEPNLERPLNMKHWKLVAVLAIASCLFFIHLYLPFGASALGVSQWLMVALWAVIGIVMLIWNKKASASVTDKERELLIFGEEYAREEITK